jgi:hypothetical protein
MRVNGSGHFAKLALAGLAVIGCAMLVAGCSSTDTMFPAVHDMPAARTETTLTPDQVKQATDSLVSERDHLNSEAQSQPTAQPISATNAPPTGSIPPKKSATSAATTEQSTSSVSAYAKQ